MPRVGIRDSRPPLRELHTTGPSRRLRWRGGDGTGREFRSGLTGVASGPAEAGGKSTWRHALWGSCGQEPSGPGEPLRVARRDRRTCLYRPTYRWNFASQTRRLDLLQSVSAGRRDPTYANRQAGRFAALDPQREGRALTQGESEVNEDRTNGQEPGVLPEQGGSVQASLSAGPEPSAMDATGPSFAGTVGAPKHGTTFTARAAGIVGVAALVVVGSLVGAAALSSSGSQPRSANIKAVLTASHDASTTSPATITVTGTGVVEGTPDTA